MRLRPSVLNQAALPLIDNFIGNVRKTMSDDKYYIWDSQSSSGLITNWKLLGSGGSGQGLFEIDINGDLMPITDINSDTNFELDVNNDIQPMLA